MADGQNGGIPKSCLENQGGMFDRLIVRPTDRPMMMKIRLSTYLPRFRSLSLSRCFICMLPLKLHSALWGVMDGMGWAHRWLGNKVSGIE